MSNLLRQMWVPYAAVFGLLQSLIIAVTLFAWNYDRADALEDAEATTSNLALAVERHVNGVFTSVDQTLLGLRELARWEGAEATRPALERLQRSFEGLFVQFTLIDPQGVAVFSSLSAGGAGVSIADREHFRFHLETPADAVFISKTVKGRVSGQWTIQITRKYTDAAGNFAGVAVLSIDPLYFGKFFGQLRLGEGGSVSIIGADGWIRARTSAGQPSPEEVYLTPLVNRPFENFPAVGTYRSISPIDGVQRVGSYHRLQDFPLTVLVFLAEADVLAAGAPQRWLLINGAIAISAVLLVCVVVMGRRARERRSALAARLHQEERWRYALDAVGDGVWDWNPGEGRLFLSAGWKAMLGYRDHEMADDPLEWENRLHPDDRVRALGDIADHLEGKTPVYRNEHRLKCADGSYRWVLARGIAVERDGAGHALRVIGTHTDVTLAKSLEAALRQRTGELEQAVKGLKSSEAELRWLSETDPLTGVVNRRAFMARAELDLARTRRYERPLTVAMLDLDHFKSVNDRYGHDAGDLVLRTAASLCKNRLRATDLFGRFGGEEFAALLTETSAEAAEKVLESVRVALADQDIVLPNGEVIRVTVSIGFVVMPPAFATIDELIKLADDAMYLAKRSGRNRVMRSPAMPAALSA